MPYVTLFFKMHYIRNYIYKMSLIPVFIRDPTHTPRLQQLVGCAGLSSKLSVIARLAGLWVKIDLPLCSYSLTFVYRVPMEDGPSAEPVRKQFRLLLDSLQLDKEREAVIREMTSSLSEGVDFTQPWPFSDITLVVEDKQIHVSKMILSMWSPVFEAMFKNNFKEKSAKEIPLPGKKYDDILALAKVLHPPNEEICGENVVQLLPLAQEYQMDKVFERCEEYLLSQASSIKNFLLAQKFNLSKLQDSTFAYLKRAPISRLKSQPEFESLDQQVLLDVLMEKCDKFESNLDSLREVRMVLERKKPTTFPGMHLLCDRCTEGREQQVDCDNCMKSCCKKITEILRNLER